MLLVARIDVLIITAVKCFAERKALDGYQQKMVADTF